MQRLAGKVALITGAGGWRAIGEATALRLASEGAAVAVADLKRPPFDIEDDSGKRLWEGTSSVTREVEALGARAFPINFDITAEDQVDEAVRAVLKHFGQIDILVNNAGASPGGDRVATVDLPKEEFERVVDINLIGTFLVSRAVAREMIKARRGGKIIIVSSVAGRHGRPLRAAYSASKFGLIGLTQVLARELGPHNINVNAVCPGTIDTSRLDSSARAVCAEQGLPWQEVRARMVAQRVAATPIGRIGTPEDIAGVVAFLASSDADFMAGQAVVADGGFVTI
ncbi:MAG: SDR family oxidoreductase [Chloroflexi bacterium]|nr:SDR family oxidoreductase [Chloroflexota bacterium]